MSEKRGAQGTAVTTPRRRGGLEKQKIRMGEGWGGRGLKKHPPPRSPPPLVHASKALKPGRLSSTERSSKYAAPGGNKGDLREKEK